MTLQAHERLQRQHDLIQQYFKTTTEPYDDLEWNGEDLYVCLSGKTIETYSFADLTDMIPNFS